ncbi:hypothetical protein [Dankookia sp. P2]|uniref:hypothetical protein n=1 Tax=Dankookia sp. P2 TaxID=3423955 RepID=UPI003D67026A
MSEHIRVSVADGVCTVAMHRPEKKNALTRDMYSRPRRGRSSKAPPTLPSAACC